MNPVISDNIEDNDLLTMTIDDINVSYVNAIRRTLLSKIPTIVFRTLPYEKNDAIFHINTSKFNNEILKQRLSCIPIHLNNLEIPIDNLVMEIDVENNTNTIIYITTEHFKIKNIALNKYLHPDEQKEIFPPNKISKQYIDFCRLQPKISEEIPGEALQLSCRFSIGTAEENGSFNVVSTCSFNNSPDEKMIAEMLPIKEQEFREKLTPKSFSESFSDDSSRIEGEQAIQQEIDKEIKDWLLLDAKRIFIPNSFHFKIQSVGVFSNLYLLKKATSIIIDKLNNIIKIFSNQNNFISEGNCTIPNSFDITLENEDYTIGKVLEFTLHQIYYTDQQSLTYCGFRKAHPHIEKSIIRLGFKDKADRKIVSVYIINAAIISIQVFVKFLSQLGEESDLYTPPSILPIPDYQESDLQAVPQSSQSLSITAPNISKFTQSSPLQSSQVPTSKPSTSHSSTSQATSQPSTSQVPTSQPSTSQATSQATSHSSTSQPSTSQASTSRPSTSRPSTSQASTSKEDTSKPATPRTIEIEEVDEDSDF